MQKLRLKNSIFNDFTPPRDHGIQKSDVQQFVEFSEISLEFPQQKPCRTMMVSSQKSFLAPTCDSKSIHCPVEISPMEVQESRTCPGPSQWLSKNPGPVQYLSRKTNLGEPHNLLVFIQKCRLSLSEQIYIFWNEIMISLTQEKRSPSEPGGVFFCFPQN